MDYLLEGVRALCDFSGGGWKSLVMFAIGILLIWLAIKKEYEPQATEAIKSRLVLEAIINAEKIEASEEEINAKMEEMAKNYGKKVEELSEVVFARKAAGETDRQIGESYGLSREQIHNFRIK